MGVVADVILTVAMVAAAAGAVAELQLGICNIGPVAYRTAVIVVGLGFLPLGRGELYHPWSGGMGGGFVASSALQLHPPGKGQEVAHICAEEQEVVQ